MPFRRTARVPHLIKVFYGSGQSFIDITEVSLARCFDGHRIYIPADDYFRADLFTDPAYGIEKNIIAFERKNQHLSCRSFGASEEVVIEFDGGELKQTQRPEGSRPRGDIRSTLFRESSVDEKIKLIHSQLQFTGGTLNDELPEQRMVVRFLEPSAKVLEIGANIGRNTLIIASLLTNSEDLVTLECDPVSIEMLKNNRFANGLNFSIEPNALSYRRLIQRGWDTIPSEQLMPGYRWVNTISFEELVAKHRIAFDTLVADCEGALYYILEDNRDILNGIHTVILESDYLHASQKAAVESTFKAFGLERVYSEPLIAAWDHPFPETCVQSFYEVWKK